MAKDCPNCGLLNPPEAQHCDCGYDFVTRKMKRSYLMNRPYVSSEPPVLGIVAGALAGGFGGYMLGVYLACVVFAGGNLCGLVGVFISGPLGLVGGGVVGGFAARRHREARERGASTGFTARPRTHLEPIVDSAITGWLDAFQAIGNMPVPAGVVFLIMLVLGAGALLLGPPPDATERRLGPELVGLALLSVQIFLVTPLAIAVHRFVLLGEVTDRYALNPSDPRFRRFFGLGLIMATLSGAPRLVSAILGKQGLDLATSTTVTLMFLMLQIIAVIISVRTVILFPAIAIDAPGAAWRNAVRDTKGHSWQVFFIVAFAVLPAIVFLTASFVLTKSAGPALPPKAIVVLAGAIVEVLTVCALAAVASRLYRAFAASLGQPSGFI